MKRSSPSLLSTVHWDLNVFAPLASFRWYRLADGSPLGNPDLVTVATRVSGGVICLISAPPFHELTTQIPHEIHLDELMRYAAICRVKKIIRPYLEALL